MDSLLLDRSAAPVATAPLSTRRPRVAIFSDALPERNGAGAYYNDLAPQLAREVERLEMFQPALKSRSLRLAVPLPGDPTQKLITPDVPRLWRQYRRLRPDVVVSVTPGPFGLLGLAFAKHSGAGFLSGFHTDFQQLMRLYGNTLFFRAAHVYLRTANRVLCSNSDAVLVNNGELAATVRALGARRVEIIGTPLAPAFLSAPPLPPQGFTRVLFAGRLAPEKNLPAVLAAARALPDLEFVIAGDGPLRQSLQRESARLLNLRLVGWLNRSALLREMDRTALLLLPSHLETFGTVALEAMARGRPALVAENAGIHDWPVLREALFVLRSDEPLETALARLRALPAETWASKAVAARRAAEALNRDTLRQWCEHLERYGRVAD